MGVIPGFYPKVDQSSWLDGVSIISEYRSKVSSVSDVIVSSPCFITRHRLLAITRLTDVVIQGNERIMLSVVQFLR